MNPFEWMKSIYGWLGAGHPRVSLLAVVILGAVLGGAFWKFSAYLYAKDHPAVAGLSTVNTTTGPQSPIIPNNGGNVTISNETTGPKQQPPKDKPK